ncbi:MAG: nucleoside hydrolase [Acidobacteriota bacterium]
MVRKLKQAWLAFSLVLGTGSLSGAPRAIPLILDTDIGTDVDDAYALVLAARCPRLDLKAVTTVYGDVALRSAIARKLLQLMDTTRVPVASGQARALGGGEVGMAGWEGRGLLAEGEVVTGVSEMPAADLIVQILMQSAEPVVVASVGGLTNVALALRRQPKVRSKIRRLVIMGGSVRPFMLQGKRMPDHLETNLHHDVDAAAEVLRAGLPITLVPAEVTFRAKLLDRDFLRIRQGTSPLARAMTLMTEDFGKRLKGFMKGFGVDEEYSDTATLLHDPLAVYSLVDPGIARIERVRIRVETESGKIRTVEDPGGPVSIDLVTGADFVRFSQIAADKVLEN